MGTSVAATISPRRPAVWNTGPLVRTPLEPMCTLARAPAEWWGWGGPPLLPGLYHTLLFVS